MLLLEIAVVTDSFIVLHFLRCCTIDVPKTAQALNKLLRQSREQNLILRSADGEGFVIAEVSDFDREIELTRENKALMRFLDSRARQPKRTPLSDVKRRLGLSK
jgi:hypothetical protein